MTIRKRGTRYHSDFMIRRQRLQRALSQMKRQAQHSLDVSVETVSIRSRQHLDLDR